ncbi:MAG: zinc dependent phospholipase C family protein [Bacteroidota bacterium]
MKLIFRTIAGIIILFSCTSWGFFAHHRINRLAVFTLPGKMAGFYQNNIDYITDHAIDPDKRRYVDSLEGSRHFLDADHYGKSPFGRIPQNWYDAVKRYTADTLDKYGTVPWVIQYHYYWLVKAFKAHDTTAILKTSANIGHYIADAHVPLHLTVNYDGQLTHQNGIHALWESRLPELFSDKYNLYVGKVKYIDNPLTEAFKICRESYKCLDSVMVFERKLNAGFPPDKKHEMTLRGKRKVKDYSVAYSAAYHKMLNGMVRRRMRAAILTVGSFWYSAWVDAGQPDLNKLIATPLTPEQKLKLAREEDLYKAGKVLALGKP